jgi:hypothetical protein
MVWEINLFVQLFYQLWTDMLICKKLISFPFKVMSYSKRVRLIIYLRAIYILNYNNLKK